MRKVIRNWKSTNFVRISQANLNLCPKDNDKMVYEEAKNPVAIKK
jgi:CO dehydrogenase/acetyl-CoA synthase alpha subunit